MTTSENGYTSQSRSSQLPTSELRAQLPHEWVHDQAVLHDVRRESTDDVIRVRRNRKVPRVTSTLSSEADSAVESQLLHHKLFILYPCISEKYQHSPNTL